MTPDVILGQSYFLRFDPKLQSAEQPYPPLGTLYAAAGVRAAGYSVALFDAMLASSETEWAEALDRRRPSIAVIYEDSFNYLSKMCLSRMRAAAMTMIDAGRRRGLPVVVAGSDASDHPELYLRRGAEAVVLGEGEVTLVELLDQLSGRSSRTRSEIAGLCYREADGGVVRTRPRSILRDLDGLPRPAWDLVDIERYRAIWRRRHGYFSMNVATTRGCPYHCNWCAKPIYGQTYAVRSPEQVAQEVAWLKRTYRPDHLWMADDIFGLKPGWIEQFAEVVVSMEAVTPFKCLLRADGVTEDRARALGRAGCRTAWIGAESGSQAVLDAMEKGTQIDQIQSATARLHAEGIEVGFFLQFGYPGETLSDIEQTLEMVRTCRPDDIGISVSYPLPGTPFYDRVKTQLGAKQNWVDSDDLAMMFRATYVPEFYRALHALAHAEFRARRGLRRAFARPVPRRSVPWRGPWLREAVGGVWHAARVPLLRRRLDRLSRVEVEAPSDIGLPMLTRGAAAIPTEQPQ